MTSGEEVEEEGKRTWKESKKQATKIGADRTASEVESSPSLLHGDGAFVQRYVQARRAVEADLDAFYNKSNSLKYFWDVERAREKDFSQVSNSLLKMIGDSIGERKWEDQKVVIVIGLAKLVSKNFSPSLDGSFQDFFV
ncbi:hypothetical protein BG005_010826 [Podila minutissima]|nr:hypothetical protein BG005_010826 [Podila minutissima]